MIYKKTEWKDHVTKHPNRYREEVNNDNTVTLIPEQGEIIQQGTPMSSMNFNKMEEGIYKAHENVNYLSKDIKDSKVFQLNPTNSNASVISYPPDTKGLFYPEVKGVKPIYQSMENGDFSENLNEWRFTNVSAYSIVNNVATFTARAHGGEVVHSSTKIIINHNYLLITRIKADSNKVRYSIAGLGLTSHSGSGNFETMYSTFHYHKSGDYGFSVTDIRDSGWTPIEVDFAMLIDLTQNNLEDKTLDELKKMFNHYYQYGLTTPSLSYDFVSRGKNKIDLHLFKDVRGVTLDDQILRFSDYADVITGIAVHLKLKPNTLYNFSCDTPDGNVYACLKDKYGEPIRAYGVDTTMKVTLSITTISGDVELILQGHRSDLTLNPYAENIMLIEDDIADTTYKPYDQFKTGFSVPRPLIKVGDVEDEILDNGDLVYRNSSIKKLDLSHLTLGTTSPNNTDIYRMELTHIDNIAKQTSLSKGRVIVPDKREIIVSDRDNTDSIGTYYTTEFYLEFVLANGTTLNTAKQELANTIIYYQLAQPETIHNGEKGYQVPAPLPAYQNGDLVQIPTTIKEIHLNNENTIVMDFKCVEILELIDSDGNTLKGAIGNDKVTITLDSNYTGVVHIKCRRDPSTCLNIIPNGLIPGNVNQRVEQNTLGILDINKGISNEEKINDMILIEHELDIRQQGTIMDNIKQSVKENKLGITELNKTFDSKEKANDKILHEHEEAIEKQGSKLDNIKQSVEENKLRITELNKTFDSKEKANDKILHEHEEAIEEQGSKLDNVKQSVEENKLGITEINRNIDENQKANDKVLNQYGSVIGEQVAKLGNVEKKVKKNETQLTNINNTISQTRTKNAAIRIETRTSDPSNAEIGRIWLRTDL